MLQVEERVDELEVLFGQLAKQVIEMNKGLVRLERITEAASERAEKDREEAEKDREEARMDREEARMGREEAKKDREEAKRERRELARQLADISHRMGTVVEDIIAPSLRRVAEKELGCGPVELYTLRINRRRSDDHSKRREFDAFYVGERAVMLNETKTTARPEYAKAFVDFLNSGEFALYFPEYASRPVIPVFSSLYLSEDLVTYLTRHGIYAVAMGDEAMAVLNLEAIRNAGDTGEGG